MTATATAGTVLAIAATADGFLPLSEAMKKAYEHTLNGPLATFARGLNNSPDEILNWYAFAAYEHLPVYGKRRPSSVLELVPGDKIATQFNFGDGAMVLIRTFEK